MIRESEAILLVRQHLADTPKYDHSRAVAELMRRLSGLCRGDAVLWAVTGLLHDLDIYETAENRSRHGMVAAEWSFQLLPDVALDAIRAHDHRTGVRSDTSLAQALKLADILVASIERSLDDYRGEEDCPPVKIPAEMMSAAVAAAATLKLDLSRVAVMATDAVRLVQALR